MKDSENMRNHKKLKDLIFEIDGLVNFPNANTPQFKTWQKKCRVFLAKYYGEDSAEFKEFSKIRYSPLVQYTRQNEDTFKKKYQSGLAEAKGLLEAFWADENISDKEVQNNKMTNSVFIVHGHDITLKIEVARLLEQQSIEAIILHEQPSLGKTIIEKIEHYSDVGAAIVLFTPDDEGKAKSEKEYKNRARQNVVFEAGYFTGYLGREKIISLISDKSIELPGDLQGIVYVEDMWQIKLMQELKARGFNVDMNKITL